MVTWRSAPAAPIDTLLARSARLPAPTAMALAAVALAPAPTAIDSAPLATASAPVEFTRRYLVPVLRMSLICVLRLTSEPSTASKASVTLSYSPEATAPPVEMVLISNSGAVKVLVSGSNAARPPKNFAIVSLLANSCAPLTASLLVALTAPAARLPMVVVPVPLPRVTRR
ncbi:hypothetical protein D3C72_1163370 [compost metagenome]